MILPAHQVGLVMKITSVIKLIAIAEMLSTRSEFHLILNLGICTTFVEHLQGNETGRRN